MIRKIPCDYGECPYNADYSEDCRYCYTLDMYEDDEPEHNENIWGEKAK